MAPCDLPLATTSWSPWSFISRTQVNNWYAALLLAQATRHEFDKFVKSQVALLWQPMQEQHSANKHILPGINFLGLVRYTSSVSSDQIIPAKKKFA